MNKSPTTITVKDVSAVWCALLISLAAMVFFGAVARAETVDEIIAKYVQAHGGMEKIKAIQAIRISGKLNAGAFQAKVLHENKRPSKVREEVTINGMTHVRAYDGNSPWQVNPFMGRKEPELLSEDDAKSLVVDADIDGPLVDYKQKGHKAEFVGHDSVEGTDCYKIKLTLKNGDIQIYYLDADSFLELKLERQITIRGAVKEDETYYGDYEEINGMYFPFAVETAQKGDPDRTKISVEKVELNVSLEDILFSMPATRPETKAAVAPKMNIAFRLFARTDLRLLVRTTTLL